MLAPRGTSAFVCLRCEAHLARPRPRPRFASFPSSRHFSASTRRRDGATELEAAVSEQSLKIDTTNSWKPRGSSRRRKVRENHATSASLGVQRLGEEARVLVLKEKLRDSSEEPEATDVIPQEAEPVDIPDILASLDQEQKVLTPEELNQLIAGLRPKSDGDPNDPTYVTQANFAKLSSVLADGFTFQQMSGFYSAAKSIPQPVAKEDSVESVGKDKKPSVRAPRRTEWQAGVTDLKTRMSRNKGQGRAVNKQVLADRILRDIWHLVTMEEIEAAGQLEMSLTEEQLNILSQSDGESILDQIGRKRRAKIEIYQNQNAKQHVIRITADKTTSEYVADDIDQCLQNLNSKQIDLAPWLKMGTPLGNYMGKPVDIEKKVLFSKENLDAIAKLTRTTLIRDWSKINIFGLDEHAIAEAERNILRSLPLHDGVKRSVYARLYKSLDKATSSSLPVPEERNASLNAEDRHTQHFGRKVLPISRASSSSPASDDAPVTDLLSKAKKEKLITEAIFQMRLKTTLPQLTEEVKDWIPEPEVSLSADFGQLLYPRSDSVFEPGSRFALFSPSIPGLANILTSPCFSATSRLGPPSLIYTFVPKFPNLASISNRAHFPTLSIQMRAGHAGIRPTLHKLSLAFHQRTHSILLPSHATDLRLRFAAQLRLKKDHADPHITSWTNDVIANIESGARLTAPPELTIPIPHVIIPGEELTATGTRNVDFVFTGIHFRQSVSGTMRDTAISYRTVQAGKSTFQDVQDRLHARAGMLSAHFGSASSSSSSSFSAANIAADLKDETKLRNWFHTILDICGDIGTAAAQKAPVGKKAVPRHEDGERKRRREMERAKAGEDGKEMKGGEQDEKEIESEEHSEKAGHEGGAEEKVTETATETEIQSQSQPQPEQSPSEIPEDLAPEQEGRRA